MPLVNNIFNLVAFIGGLDRQDGGLTENLPSAIFGNLKYYHHISEVRAARTTSLFSTF